MMEHIPLLGETEPMSIGITDALGIASLAKRVMRERDLMALTEQKSVAANVRPHVVSVPIPNTPVRAQMTGVSVGPMFRKSRMRKAKVEALKDAIIKESR